MTFCRLEDWQVVPKDRMRQGTELSLTSVFLSAYVLVIAARSPLECLTKGKLATGNLEDDLKKNNNNNLVLLPSVNFFNLHFIQSKGLPCESL